MTELSRDAVALIQTVGTADGPSEESRARVRRQLALGLGLAGAGVAMVKGAKLAGAGKASLAAGSAATVAATKLSTTVISVVLWAAAGGALGLSVMVPAVMLTSPNETPSAKTRAVSERRSVTNVEPTPNAGVGEPKSVSENPAPVAVPVPAPAAAKSPLAPRLAPASAPAQAAAVEKGAVGQAEEASEVSLGTEMRLLQAAQRELAQKRAAAALALLDEHAAKFPKGALSAERSAARVVALCALGRRSEARSLGSAFLAAAPRSPLVPRIRESCAFAGDAERVQK